ncbi:MAG: SGNH/GDSL hydrolase family protein [Planctomycetota bacterium]
MHQVLATAVAALLAALPAAVGAQAPTPVRMMPLGDSITEGAHGSATYRYYLWHALLDAGYCVDFVGGQQGVQGGRPWNPNFDQDHEGHSGWRADMVLGSVRAWTAQHDPDVVLLHLGTNDLWQAQSAASTLTEIDAIIDEMRAARSDVVILLAQIIPVGAWVGFSVDPLNALLPAFAAAKHAPSAPVLLVDQWTGFDPRIDTDDGVHPNRFGDQKMAAAWLSALETLLADCTAEYQSYGAGCGAISGTPGAPTLQTTAGPPITGTTFALQLDIGVTGLPSAGLLGTSDAAWRGLSLPLDLMPAGMPGCALLAAPDLAMPLGALGASGAVWQLPIPDRAWAVGRAFYVQGLVLAPGTNPAGMLLSNAGAARIGAR